VGKATQIAPRATDARFYMAQAYAQSIQYDKSRTQMQALREVQLDSLPALSMAITLDLIQGRLPVR
jgi:hypothetical protein